MANVLNQPFADALAKQYPAPEGIKIFTAGPDAAKMLAFWSVKQETVSCVLRIGNDLARFVLHSCPHCHEHLSAQSVKMSQKEREMMAALMQMLKQPTAPKAASKAPAKPAKPAPVQAAPVSAEEQAALDELDRLTTPGGAQ